MAEKSMYILNNDTQYYPYCRLQLIVETFEPTNQNSIKVPKVVKLLNSPMSLPPKTAPNRTTQLLIIPAVK